MNERTQHLAFSGIVWPVLVWSHRAPPPMYTHTLAGMEIGPVQPGWSSYSSLNLLFGTCHLEYHKQKRKADKQGFLCNRGFLPHMSVALHLMSVLDVKHINDLYKALLLLRLNLSLNNTEQIIKCHY